MLELRLIVFLVSPPDALTSHLILVHFVDGTGQFSAPHFTGQVWVSLVRYMRVKNRRPTAFFIVLRLRICGVIPPLLHMPSWPSIYINHKNNFIYDYTT